MVEVADPVDTVPTATFEDVQDPLDVSVSVIVDPPHTTVGPVIGGGNGFTVNDIVLEHPLALVNVNEVTPAGATGCTTPLVDPMVAIEGKLLVHTPLEGLEASVTSDPKQVLLGEPIIGKTSTESILEARHPVESV